MFKLAIDKPVIVSVAMAIVCLFGLLAIQRVPIQMIPDLDPRVVSVRTNWVGATPQDVEQEILVRQGAVPGANSRCGTYDLLGEHGICPG